MPIEFSVAAYRLGHSMMRAAYNWNKDFDAGAGALEYLFMFSGLSGDLGGDLHLPSNWIADFRRLYDFGEAGRADLVVPAAKFNHARRIDTKLVEPAAATCRSGTIGDPSIPTRTRAATSRSATSTRAKMVKLATGQQMLAFLQGKGIAITGSRTTRSATATAARRSAASRGRSATRCSRTRRSGSTSCARPS